MTLLGYLITFHTYGSWLHGRDKGSTDKDHNKPNTERLPPNPHRESIASSAMTQSPVMLDQTRRSVVDATIREVCTHRGWTLHALNVRTTHLHVVVTADRTPERVMTDFKAYSTRRMREAAVLPASIDPWSYHGSTRYLDSSNSLARAIDYTLNDQGSCLPIMPPVPPAR